MEQWIALAKLSEVPDGTMRKFAIDFRKGWLIRRGETLKAYVDHCTHAGGTLGVKDGRFECHRHGATFDITTGVPMSGPALDGDPLSHVELKIEEGTIYFKRILTDD